MMVGNVLSGTLVVAVVIQLILLIVLLRAGWRRDRQKQARFALWSSIAFFVDVLLIIANPVTSKASRAMMLVAAVFAALSVVFNVRRLKSQSRNSMMRH